MSGDVIWAVAAMGVAGGAGGANLLRSAWADRRFERPSLIAGGWAVLVATIVTGSIWIGAVKGAAVAAIAISIGALGVIARGRIRRVVRAPRDSLAPEPLEGPSKAWRGWLKALLAGPLGMTAAMGIAFCYTAWVPGDPRTRIVIGGLLFPVFWALAMTWTLADQRLLRALAVLSGTTVIGFALAAARGFV